MKSREVECVICHKIFSHNSTKKRLCCSKKCGQIYQFGSLPYTKEETLSKIKQIIDENNRLPTTKEIERKLYTAIQRFFGTWNNLVTQLGYEPNKQCVTRKRIKCYDGHIADSISERIIDDWFFENKLSHTRHKRYPDRRLTCDFYLKDFGLWVEYFGLYEESSSYDETVEEKIEIAKKNNIMLVSLYKEDLYPTLTLEEKFKDII